MPSSSQWPGSSKQRTKFRPVLFCLWLAAIAQLVYLNTFRSHQANKGHVMMMGDTAKRLNTLDSGLPEPLAGTRETTNWMGTSQGDLFGGFVLGVEAGKKKKKEKSEVIVISVQNSPAKGGGMYPVYIPSCGGGGGGGGHGGYGRRRRRSI